MAKQTKRTTRVRKSPRKIKFNEQHKQGILERQQAVMEASAAAQQAVNERNAYVKAVADICGVDIEEAGWSIDLENAQFVEQLAQNGEGGDGG